MEICSQKRGNNAFQHAFRAKMKSRRGGKATMAPLELAPLEIDSFENCRDVGGSKMTIGEE